MANKDLLNDFMKRRAQWFARDADVTAAFIALQRQVDICAAIMRRDGIAASDFDDETIARLQTLGRRFASLRQSIDRDYPPPLPGPLPDAAR